MKNNDLFDFMLSATKEMSDEYQRIQKRALEDPGTAGDQGEENWAELLKNWLPPTYQIVTKGRILSHDGIASPQIDILVLLPEYPKHLLNKKLYLAGGVAAAFECKITLKSTHIKEAMKNAATIRKYLPKRYGTPYKELNSPLIYGLLAHSHSWKEEKSKPLENIESNLIDLDKSITSHPLMMLDLICVADLATWFLNKATFLSGSESMYGPKGSAVTGYIKFCRDKYQFDNFTPIGTLISLLLRRLAWENQNLRPLSEYFQLVDLTGSGSGKLTLWDTSIYSDEIREKVVTGQLTDDIAWDEWSIDFF